MGQGAVNFDFTINLTTIIGVVVWLVTLGIAWAKFGGRMDILELRVSSVEKTLDKIADVLVTFQTNEKTLVVIEEQITNLQRQQTLLHDTVEQLRKGDGWITGRRSGIEGEYPETTPRARHRD